MMRILWLIFLSWGSICASGQNLTGIWRGYFSSSTGLYSGQQQEEVYRYEVQIAQSPNKAIKGVTFSYKTTVFYGKAKAQGIYNTGSKTLLLKETEMIELKAGEKSEACLMTCYLDYSKMGKLEVLQGTFISQNIRDKGDCGSGKVYLEKVPVSDFEKEPFLKNPANDTLAKNNAVPSAKPNGGNEKKATGLQNDSPAAKAKSKTAAPSAANAAKTTVPPTGKSTAAPTAKNTVPVAPSKPAAKPAASPAPSTPKQVSSSAGSAKKADKPATSTTASSAPTSHPSAPVPDRKPETTVGQPQTKKQAPLPTVLRERENSLVKTLTVDDPNILIELYDNGTIDNDSISVYHNNELVIHSGRLSYAAQTYKIKASPEERFHDLVVVAENLGEIPPNTALMVITAGKKRYEIFLTSTEKQNAKVRIEFTGK